MCEACLPGGQDEGTAFAASRRGFLLLGVGLLAGCATRQAAVGPALPGPPWPKEEPQVIQDPAAAPVEETERPAPSRWAVLPRSSWAGGDPIPSRMDRMTRIGHITIHHDGMEPFYGTDRRDVAAHLESIRRLHRRKGWGDIGYHFAVDRAGRIWEARPLGYQGAHVKDHNPGNVGIVVLGNFEQQSPTEAQLAAVSSHVAVLMQAFRITIRRVHTHQEWAGAKTACPGSALQRKLNQMRRSGMLG